MNSIYHMRVAVFGTKRQEFPEVIKKLEATLKRKNITPDTSYFQGSVDEMKDDLEHTYNKVKNIIQKADMIIVEVTNFSTGMGLIIGRIMEQKKPMLLLFDKDHQTERGYSVLVKAHGKNLKKVFYEEYDDESLESIVSQFISEGKKLLNTKYLFNLTPEMAQYLQWASEYYGKPMVDILRELLERQINSDKEWKEFMKD